MESSSHPGPASPGGTSRIPPVNGVGKPCAGEPHARIDGRELETERCTGHGHDEEHPRRETAGGTHGSTTYRRSTPPRQLPTLQRIGRSARVRTSAALVTAPIR